MHDQTTGGDAAFGFYGDWREFAPIAFTNLLLTIVTLGIYHFWAKTRVRRYLWSRTRFIDDRLDWTGTGLELFIGYLIAFALFVVPFGVLNLILQGVLLRGHPGWAGVIGATVYLLLIYLVGVAIFRALRYRLSRTFWHGIRGGSDDQGFAYGWQYFWRTIVGMFAAGLMVPWSMTTLWNRRWGRMSFGPMPFTADAKWQPIFPRYMLFYLAPIILFIGFFVIGLALAGFGAGGAFNPDTPPTGGTLAAIVIVAALAYIGFFGVLGLIAMIFYAAYYREAVGTLTLGRLSFAFNARTMDWIKLYLGNIGLVLVTFGVGYIFIPYRNWAFFVRHMEAFGDIHLDDLTRSTTREPGQGEGLLDAFDVGAF
jgi:uncharacterized membrane protein YjgN (DUF898 family)